MLDIEVMSDTEIELFKKEINDATELKKATSTLSTNSYYGKYKPDAVNI